MNKRDARQRAFDHYEAARLGFTVLRFASSQIVDGTALGYIERMLTQRRAA